MNKNSFSGAIIAWYQDHGRKDLPWQKPASAYRVWVSEVMLQQTQVSTVIPYFKRFMREFRTLRTLAASDINQVLGLWSGLGYYARAHNLHKTAEIIHTRFKGRFPKSMDALCELPGIGRSTAGAILSLAMKISAPILDGNVKRILSRYHALPGHSGQSQFLKTLWQLAENYTPESNCQYYNQAMMDLGALICTRLKPQCNRCPLMTSCQAFKENTPLDYPQKKPKKHKPQRQTWMIILQAPSNSILLEKRPNSGIWGGLWSFPECANEEEITTLCFQKYQCDILSREPLPILNHSFTHFNLKIRPIVLKINNIPQSVRESDSYFWYTLGKILPGGIAAPVSKLLTIIHSFKEGV